MEIYVLVKQVPDPEAIVRVKSETELDIENKYFTNFFDEIAIEAALRLKEKVGGKVTALTVDNKKVNVLRRSISMGADEAFQITDSERFKNPVNCGSWARHRDLQNPHSRGHGFERPYLQLCGLWDCG